MAEPGPPHRDSSSPESSPAGWRTRSAPASRTSRALRVAALAGLIGLAAWGAAGCGSLQLTTINTLARFGDYELSRDLAYGDAPAQRLDVYAPDDVPAGDDAPPIVVFFHGGNWSAGDKSEYQFVGEALAARGMLAVLAETRLHPQVGFPTFVQDAAQAVAWVHENAAQLGGDADSLFLMGHSSGAHMAALLVLDPDYLRRAGGDVDWIRGFIGLAGPYDFSPTRPDIRDVFAGVENLATTQPIQYASSPRVPLLLMHGENDDTVKKSNAVNLAAAVERAGGTVVTHYYEGVDHRTIIGALSIPLRGSHAVLDDIAAFVSRFSEADAAAP